MHRACNLHRKRLSGGIQLQERVTGDVPRAEPNRDPGVPDATDRQPAFGPAAAWRGNTISIWRSFS
jgi:hypothetical protein